MRACSSATRKSFKYSVRSVARPSVTASPSTIRSRVSTVPPVVRVRNRISVRTRSPVEEDADDVGDERGEKTERQRHVDVEPDFEPAANLRIPAQPFQHDAA